MNQRTIGLCIFALIHSYFIFQLLAGGVSAVVILILGLIVAFAYLGGYIHNRHNPAVDAARISSTVFSAAVGGVCCYLLSSVTNPILACGVVGFLASYLSQLFKGEAFHELPYSTYCGCFVGMSAHTVLPNATTVAVVAAFSGLLFALTKQSLEGVGGRLGSLSFAVVVCYVMIHNWM